MIEPTVADLGRKVVYRDPFKDEPEEGVLSGLPTSENPNCGKAVWVRFKGPQGEMTPLDRLEWAEAPSQHGAILGETLADIAKAGDVGLGILSTACATCAFREGAMPNRMAATGLLALNCVLDVDPDDFACHHGMKDGQPTKLCAGYLAAKNAPWPVVKAAVQTLYARLATLADDDPIRADFVAWAARADPEGKLDVYQQARIYAKEMSR